jgi:hypothetical protein
MRATIGRMLPVGCCLLAALLVLAVFGITPAAAQISSPTSGEESVYRDPQGRYSVPVPTNWVAEEHEGYVRLVTDDQAISMSLVIINGTSASDAIAQAMQLIDPAFDATPLPNLMATPSSGSDDIALFTYDDASTSGQLVQADGQRVENVVFVLVLQGDAATIGLRQVQVDKIRLGVKVNLAAIASPVATPAG